MWVEPLAEPPSTLRWCPTWLAVASKAAPCSWPKGTQTSAGTPVVASATWTSCASLSSSMVRRAVVVTVTGQEAGGRHGSNLARVWSIF